jgi:hypothetical protein
MKIKAVVIILIVVLGIFHSAVAQNVRIRLEKCQLEPETLHKIQNSLNFQLQFYGNIFNAAVDSSFKARIFGSESDFIKYSKTKANYNPRANHAMAFYDHNLKEMILHKNVDDLPKVFGHELSHAILDYYCKDAHSWIHEGLAELLEDIVLIDSIPYFGVGQLDEIVSAQRWFQEGASVTEVVNGNGDFYHLSSESRNYSLAFATVLYLYAARGEVLSNFLQGECNGRYDNLDLCYPKGLDLLEIDVRSYFLNYRPNPE